LRDVGLTAIDRPVEAEARLRRKNQLTVPEPIVRALDAAPDDVLVFEADPSEPGVAHVRVLPRDFAGSLTGVFGSSEEALEYVRGEREAWAE
jgi:bifunctional DNA-binding transcriptional regulator/antitoxin component of YhaV-PrlF toxin-antitoxin module